MAELYHPDKVGHLGPRLREVAEEEMRKLNVARDTLLDPKRREEYDRQLQEKAAPKKVKKRPRKKVTFTQVDDPFAQEVMVEVEPLDDDERDDVDWREVFTQIRQEHPRSPPQAPPSPDRVEVTPLTEEPAEPKLDEFQGTLISNNTPRAAPKEDDTGDRGKGVKKDKQAMPEEKDLDEPQVRFVSMQPITFEKRSPKKKRKRKKRKKKAGSKKKSETSGKESPSKDNSSKGNVENKGSPATTRDIRF